MISVHGYPSARTTRSRAAIRLLVLVATSLLVVAVTTAHAATATASWNPNPEPDIAGYKLSYGTSSGSYSTTVGVGKVTSYVVQVVAGQTYYFVVRAYNTAGLLSPPSSEVAFAAATTTLVPTITSLSPTAASVGTSVTISGTNFGATRGTSTITFNGTAATPTAWSGTSIVAPVPSGATTGIVVVTVGGVASNGFVFTVTTTATPTVTSLTPTSGPVGTSVTIAGANFGATQGTSKVTFNGTTATPTSWSASSIAVPVPAGATTGSVIVTVAGVASNAVTFTVTAPATTAAIALTQHASSDAGTTTLSTLAFPAANVAGHWIGVVIRAGGSSQVFTVTDTNGNTYRKAIQVVHTADSVSMAVYYAENVRGGANTVTVADTASGTLRIAILEYAGVATAGSLDVTTWAQGSSSSPSSGNATTTGSGDLLLGAFTTANGQTTAAGSGFVMRESVPTSAAKLNAEDSVQTAAGTAAATATLAASDN